jgi:hypothetical protein
VSAQAEPFNCAVCGRCIGARRAHLITETSAICCAGCALKRSTHAVIYPDCAVPWHDFFDHPCGHATRAAARWLRNHKLPPGHGREREPRYGEKE